MVPYLTRYVETSELRNETEATSLDQ